MHCTRRETIYNPKMATQPQEETVTTLQQVVDLLTKRMDDLKARSIARMNVLEGRIIIFENTSKGINQDCQTSIDDPIGELESGNVDLRHPARNGNFQDEEYEPGYEAQQHRYAQPRARGMNNLRRDHPIYPEGGRNIHTSDPAKHIKIDIPDYDGNLDPKVFNNWLKSLERYFRWYETEEVVKLCFATLKLKGAAQDWWYAVEEDLQQCGLHPISNWEEMKAGMKRRFLPLDYETTSFQELLTLRQDNQTVEEYTQHYYDLVIRCRLTETEIQQVVRYCNGLRFEIQRELVTIRLNNVDDAYQMARKGHLLDEVILQRHLQETHCSCRLSCSQDLEIQASAKDHSVYVASEFQESPYGR